MADEIPLLTSNNGPPARRLGRSVAALLAGFVVVLVLTLGTDVALHAAGIFPPLGQPTPDGPLALATFYRVVFAIVGSYLTARLAPHGPMGHALVGGLVGLALSTAGAMGTWNLPISIGHHWYPLALVATSLPCAWAGGKIRVAQLSGRAGNLSGVSD